MAGPLTPSPEALPASARSLLRILRDRRNVTGLACAHCQSKHTVRWGQFRGRQRYRCKQCGRTFNDLTATPFHHSKRLDLWPRYLVALEQTETIRASAKHLGVHPTTTFRWRHRYLAAVARGEDVALSGVVEIMRFVISCGEKGKRNLSRRPYARGLRGVGRYAAPDRFFGVLQARDRAGASVHVFCRASHTPTTADYCALLDVHLPRITLLISDAKRLSAMGVYCRVRDVAHIQVPSARQLPEEWVARGVHRENSADQIARLRDWMYGFRGVSRRYLANYLAWHRFLEGTHPELIAPRWVAAAVP